MQHVSVLDLVRLEIFGILQHFASEDDSLPVLGYIALCSNQSFKIRHEQIFGHGKRVCVAVESFNLDFNARALCIRPGFYDWVWNLRRACDMFSHWFRCIRCRLVHIAHLLRFVEHATTSSNAQPELHYAQPDVNESN
jgi:hypothetical protein